MQGSNCKFLGRYTDCYTEKMLNINDDHFGKLSRLVLSFYKLTKGIVLLVSPNAFIIIYYGRKFPSSSVVPSTRSVSISSVVSVTFCSINCSSSSISSSIFLVSSKSSSRRRSLRQVSRPARYWNCHWHKKRNTNVT